MAPDVRSQTVGNAIVDTLLNSAEPSVRWKVRTRVLGEDPASTAIRRLQDEIRRSPRVRQLLAGVEGVRTGVYAKWQGAHWVLATLADVGYPAGDDTLAPLRDDVLDTWLHENYYREFETAGKAESYRRRGVPMMEGRYRRCASQQGNALWFLTVLGLANDRTVGLVERLLHWQWPDGGWNCDRSPSAHVSSFAETCLPLRGLAAHARFTDDEAANAAAKRAAEVFLQRRLAFRRSDGGLIHREFAQLHYPLYWHYDVLGGLKVIAEAGAIADDRCCDALDLLEAKRLPDGGWPAEKRYYRCSAEIGLGNDFVDWGGTSTKRSNEWVTADALAVLRAAGRLHD